MRGTPDLPRTPGSRPNGRMPEPMPGGEHTVPTFQAPGAKPVVLVVDEEPFVRRVVSRLLGRVGYRTLQAETGREALSLLQDPDRRVDVLVADTGMSGTDATELLREARSREPETKALFMCSRAAGGHADDLPRPVLTKPFGSTRLYEAVEGLLEGSGPQEPPPTTAAGD